ncbi:MAG TPA: helix-hairpin-helix domain-containing protein [Methylomirabilota bacterium]|nr:helix-hairpin-helix domain-containing protein [Methylomirabilota bacterium]
MAGWVRRPGVYEFHEGDRVIDAIEAAGGARRGAALESLNLAMPLVDGTQVLVPRTAAGGAPGAVASDGSASTGKLNINTATAAELEALPGVGEVIAQRIVDYRTDNGPFGSVDELIDVSGIGESTLASMRELVTV